MKGLFAVLALRISVFCEAEDNSVLNGVIQ